MSRRVALAACQARSTSGGMAVPAVHDQTLLIQLTLRTLGDVGGSIGLHGSDNTANNQP